MTNLWRITKGSPLFSQVLSRIASDPGSYMINPSSQEELTGLYMGYLTFGEGSKDHDLNGFVRWLCKLCEAPTPVDAYIPKVFMDMVLSKSVETLLELYVEYECREVCNSGLVKLLRQSTHSISMFGIGIPLSTDFWCNEYPYVYHIQGTPTLDPLGSTYICSQEALSSIPMGGNAFFLIVYRQTLIGVCGNGFPIFRYWNVLPRVLYVLGGDQAGKCCKGTKWFRKVCPIEVRDVGELVRVCWGDEAQHRRIDKTYKLIRTLRKVGFLTRSHGRFWLREV